MYSDAARFCADAVNAAVHAGGVGKWIAVRLSDGKSDGKIYLSKGEAIKFQLWEFQCAYLKVSPGGMQPGEAERYLAMHRKLYDKGLRLSDPDMQPILPYTREALKLFMRS